MLASVASLAVQIAMPRGEAIQFANVFRVGGVMALVAPRLGDPGIAYRISYVLHIAMAILAGFAC